MLLDVGQPEPVTAVTESGVWTVEVAYSAKLNERVGWVYGQTRRATRSSTCASTCWNPDSLEQILAKDLASDCVLPRVK